jgi:hypothetical protein
MGHRWHYYRHETLGSKMNTQLLSRTASWVIVDNSTGKAVLETFNAALIDKINASKYTAVPILQYLQGLNKK